MLSILKLMSFNKSHGKIFLLFAVLFIIACSNADNGKADKVDDISVNAYNDTNNNNNNNTNEVDNMKLVSSAFKHEGNIPSKYTCDGENIAVPLEIQDVPKGTKTLALIMDDPDAPSGDFVHWVIWNIPIGKEIKGEEGKTSFGKNGYGGPCPPSGTHRYYFKLFALDTTLNLPKSSTKYDLLRAMDNHIIEETVLMGKYKRTR